MALVARFEQVLPAYKVVRNILKCGISLHKCGHSAHPGIKISLKK